MEGKELELLKASQQLLGFYHNEDGCGIKDLISGMGLTLDELNELKRQEDPIVIKHYQEIKESI